MVRVTLFFTLQLFKKKNMIRKASFLNQESPRSTLKIFKLLDKREEQCNNLGKQQ